MRVQAFIGIIVFLAIAWLFSEKRRMVRISTVITGVVVQFAIAGVLLYVPLFRRFFLLLNNVVLALDSATRAGTSFVFGYVGGGPPPFMMQDPGANFVLAFQSLPLVLVIGALSSLLFYWKVLPYIVQACSLVLRKTLHIGGALGLGAST